jgi:DNA invertase Pin-like site-specific DNA recombinase
MKRVEVHARDLWVSYLRVSTPEQAERELSLPAQRLAVEEYAKRLGHAIAFEYLEAGRTATTSNRLVFRQMLEDIFRPGSRVGTIVVSHTSRFTRNAAEARIIKEKLRKIGVRVVSISQETHDDPMGQLIEGIFECIDQYESELNGLRTTAALREIIRQGFFPGGSTPYGFMTNEVEIRKGVFRQVLVPNEQEARIVRELFQLYVARDGAKRVAATLNERGHLYRDGKRWTKDIILRVLAEPAVGGTYFWGKHDPRTRVLRDPSEWLALTVEPIVEPSVRRLALELRTDRSPERTPGRAASVRRILAGLVRCAKCESSYTLETSGKRTPDGSVNYSYYNCRATCRIGKAACPGGRVPVTELDDAVLAHLATVVCTTERCRALRDGIDAAPRSRREARRQAQLQAALEFVRERIEKWSAELDRSPAHQVIGRERLTRMRTEEREILAAIRTPSGPGHEAVREEVIDLEALRRAWTQLILSGGEASLNYLHHLVERIDIDGFEVRVLARAAL